MQELFAFSWCSTPLHGSAPRGSAAFVGSQLQCLSTCISAFLSQLPGAHPSCRERPGGGWGDRGGSDEEAGEMGVKGCRCFLGKPQGMGEEAPGGSCSVLVLSDWSHLTERQERTYICVNPSSSYLKGLKGCRTQLDPSGGSERGSDAL